MGEELIISVKNVTKTYPLYDRHADRVKEAFHPLRKKYHRPFNALTNVSFDVKKGETLGIIGRNGSGKSTLLQIICGILQPTSGTIEVNGRISALLELGTGFNPEFTGRQNVDINGAILGLKREEIEARFDEIATFADIGDFIDQPVKTYSSGMYVRLAFAVAASFDADVLIVDEALAVGDVFFRQKCYQRLEALREKGVSIVLVSHGMMEVEQFCHRVLLLHHGQMIFEGLASEAVKRYYLIEQQDRLAAQPEQPQAKIAASEYSSADDEFWPAPEAFLDISGVEQISNGWARCTGVVICNGQGQPSNVFQQGETATFFYEFELLCDIEVPIGGIEIQNEKGIIIHGKNTLEYGSDVPRQVVQGSRLRFRQDIDLEIAVGEYTFTPGLAMISRYDYEHKSLYSYNDLNIKIVRLCHLPVVGNFAVVFRKGGKPVQLLHHGAANLRGKCKIFTAPDASFKSLIEGCK